MGPNGLDYFIETTETDVFTNLSNDNSVTSFEKLIEKDKRVTEQR